MLDPRRVLPSKNFTVPVAVTGEMIAVSVTLLPTRGDVLDAERDVLEAVRAETATGDEVLVACVESPLYTAVYVWFPTLIELTLKVDTPFESGLVPSVVAPSMKVTVPVAAVGAKVAVNVTVEPDAGVVFDAVRAVVVVSRLKVALCV
jgi:hypothetical protein